MNGVKPTTCAHHCVNLLLAFSLVSGCVAQGGRVLGWQQQINHLELDKTHRTSLNFNHLLVYNRQTTGTDLHVYIEGDGRPFITRTRVAIDPTPRTSRLLDLVASDPYPALFVSRPCYFATMDDRCTPELWTIARYSERVVASLAEVINDEWHARGQPRLTLIGYSGGGALALLLGSRLPRVNQVVTLHGNLDPERWARLHGYTPLVGSLSPLDQKLGAEVAEFHVLGARDAQIPPQSVARYTTDPLRQRDNFIVCRVAGCTHEGCWTSSWPRVLEQLKRQGNTCEVLR